jgi:hypothetical protein
MTNKITIDGLTTRQCEICDMLWECSNIDEVRFLLDYVLDDHDRMTALTLIEIIHMEAAERDGELEAIAPLVDRMLTDVINKVK